MFILLAGATILCVAIWSFRSDYSEIERYAFLIWNLFLAWIQFMISYFTYTLTLNRRWVYIFIPVGVPVVDLLYSKHSKHNQYAKKKRILQGLKLIITFSSVGGAAHWANISFCARGESAAR